MKTARPAGAGFAAAFGITLAVILTLVSGLTFWRDPLWVFREAPPWTRDGIGASSVLDVEMRLVKPLQLARIRPGTVLVGSSVAYRGLDPHDLSKQVPQPAYNAGISSLMAAELPTMAALIVDIGSVRRVVLGLDYFMFTRMLPPPPMRPALATRAGRFDALVGTVLNPDAIERLARRGQVRTEPGAWRGDGFKITPDFDAALTQRVAAAQDIAAMAYWPERLRDLDTALTRLSGMELSLYLSPMSAAQRRLIVQGGRAAEFARWRADVAALAAAKGLTLHDLVDAHPFEDFDPTQGSSHFWIDNLHFKPELGRWILARLGLA